jgi:heavy metal translocating P-type ATPase
MYNCDHCRIEFPEKDAVFDEIDGHKKVFCCHGCHGIYLLVHEAGLDSFYDRRTGWKPGPAQEAVVSSDVFLDSIADKDGQSEIDLNISGIRCASCIWLIEHYLSKVDGITFVNVNYATHRARVRWITGRITIEDVLKKIASIGYLPRPYTASIYEEQIKEERRDLLIRFGTASFLSMQLMLYTVALYAGFFHGMESLYRKLFQVIALIISTPVIFYCGYPFLKGFLRGIKNRTLNMDTLIFAGSFSAYAYSIAIMITGSETQEVYFDTSAMIITLILLGRYIEAGAKGRAIGAISSLISLQPKDARLVKSKDEKPVQVPVAILKPGNLIEVIPGDRIPVDGKVVEGSSEADESMLTGESKPVAKSKGCEVFTGTMNINGRLVINVLKTGRETALAHIIRAVEDAQSRKAHIQTVADKVVAWFVPAIIAIAGETFAFWFLHKGDISSALMNSVAVLVIACPCALGLATPLAVLVGSGIMSSMGVLVKGGDILEVMGKADFIYFDKTGTLTKGDYSLSEIVTYGTDKTILHTKAASVERGSEHAIGRALTKDIDERSLYGVRDFKAHSGKGVEGYIDDDKIVLGNKIFLEDSGVELTRQQAEDFGRLSAGGSTVIGIAWEGALHGWFIISDRLRDESVKVVAGLKSEGYSVGLITGDNRFVAEDIAKKAGINIVESEILPLGKAEKVRSVKADGHKVVMVGDGINDAPALTEADAGVAMGSASDIAMGSADVVLMRNDLGLLVNSLRLAKRTLSIIKQNLFWAFSYNLIAIPLAVSGKIHPVLSAAFMAASSLLVVGNSLRLYKKVPE